MLTCYSLTDDRFITWRRDTAVSPACFPASTPDSPACNLAQTCQPIHRTSSALLPPSIPLCYRSTGASLPVRLLLHLPVVVAADVAPVVAVYVAHAMRTVTAGIGAWIAHYMRTLTTRLALILRTLSAVLSLSIRRGCAALRVVVSEDLRMVTGYAPVTNPVCHLYISAWLAVGSRT